MLGQTGVLLLCTAAIIAGAVGDAGASRAGAAATVRQLAAAGDWPPDRLRPVLDELDQETRRFVAMHPNATAQRVGDELIPTLASIQDGLTARLDGMRNEVLERDGDLEGLLASRAYRDRETLQLTALYHLSWARYQQAQTMPAGSSARRTLLRHAVRGFTEFVYVNEVSQVYGDCLYGRGLAFYALGQTQNARADLQAVIDLGSKHASYARARAALSAVRSGKPVTAPAAPDPTATQLARLKALLEAHSAIPADADNLDAPAREKRARAQDEALTLARSLATRNESTAARVEALVQDTAPPAGAFTHVVRGEIASDRDDSTAARDEYAAAMAAADLDAQRLHPRSSFGLAVAHYQLGEYTAAAAAFAEFANAHPDAADTAGALYFRFKAIEAGRSADGSDGPEEYLEAARTYVARFPDGAHAAELRYRAAEVQQSQGKCPEALTTLAAGPGTGTDAWSLWGRFLALQCQADRTRAAWRAGAADVDALYGTTIESARTLAVDAARGDGDGDAGGMDVAPLGAQASLLGALVAAAAPTPRPGDVLGLVDEFETRYPESPELFGDAIAVRAVAHLHAGDIDDASADVDRLGTLKSAEADAHLRHVGSAVIRESNSGDAARRKTLLPVARHVYEQLVARGTRGSGPPDAADVAMLAEIALEQDDIDAAAQAYGRLLEIDPDSLEGRRGLAKTSETQGKHGAALTHWRQLIEQTAPGDTLWFEATIHAAQMQDALGQSTDACTTLTEATRQATFPTTGDLGTVYTAVHQRVCR
jgi:tetratricopeptide (TPR) repeat protein